MSQGDEDCDWQWDRQQDLGPTQSQNRHPPQITNGQMLAINAEKLLRRMKMWLVYFTFSSSQDQCIIVQKLWTNISNELVDHHTSLELTMDPLKKKTGKVELKGRGTKRERPAKRRWQNAANYLIYSVPPACIYMMLQ